MKMLRVHNIFIKKCSLAHHFLLFQARSMQMVCRHARNDAHQQNKSQAKAYGTEVDVAGQINLSPEQPHCVLFKGKCQT